MSAIEKILFIDIETVPRWSSFEETPAKFQALWEQKARYLSQSSGESPAELYERAGIYAEFGKIICISAGYINNDQLKVTSYAGHDEKELLMSFAGLLNRHYNRPDQLLCAHNGKEFDYPYIARRMVVHGIAVPAILNIQGKKPWEVTLLDTMEMWKFGDYKNYTSLALLTALFDIPTPKDDISGADVAMVYWQENDLERIVHYCCKDVIAVVQLYRRFMYQPLIPDDKILIV